MGLFFVRMRNREIPWFVRTLETSLSLKKAFPAAGSIGEKVFTGRDVTGPCGTSGFWDEVDSIGFFVSLGLLDSVGVLGAMVSGLFDTKLFGVALLSFCVEEHVQSSKMNKISASNVHSMR
ncbi:MAG: hypothetical protein IKM34_04310 [Clostridia bacterium]|nr:hypothetical protein [Clostridia bacterium]